MKLALGTVQFGLPYGIANAGGQVGEAAAATILALARESGIDTIDTAIGYGESEAVLGRIGVGGLRVVTKLPSIPADSPDVAGWASRLIEESLVRLGIERLGGVLLHRPDQLLGPGGEALAGALCGLKADGLVEKVGVSIYAPDDLPEMLAICPIDLLQAPFNLVDRRLAAGRWLERLKGEGVEIHVRSVFLQGLLLMPAPARPAYFDRWQSLWSEWEAWLAARPGLDRSAACIGFAESFDAIDRLVVGVDSVEQLEMLVAAAARSRVPDFPDIACNDEELINPALWSKV